MSKIVSTNSKLTLQDNLREKIEERGGNSYERTISICKNSKKKKKNKDNDIFDIVYPATILCNGITVFKES